jgi:DnaA-homolog protein
LHQLALPIQSPTPPTLDNFVCGRNHEAVAALRSLATHPEAQTFIYLWGQKGCGKTHLLMGLSSLLKAHNAQESQYINAQDDPHSPLTERCNLLIDNVNFASAALGESLFHAWNHMREAGGYMVCTGDTAPAGLALAPELSSRLAWGQVYRIYNLNDEEKWEALKLKASSDAIPITDEAISYLLMHSNRDMPSLIQSLEQLDHLSLSSQRSIGVSLVRSYLAAQHS